MTLESQEVQTKLAEWQEELREITGNYFLVLKAYKDPRGVKKISEIIDVVCEETGVNKDKLIKKERKRELVIARQLIFYYGKMCTGMSLKELGGAIGGRDHTTVIHSIQTIKDLLDSNNPAVCGAVAKINVRLNLNDK